MIVLLRIQYSFHEAISVSLNAGFIILAVFTYKKKWNGFNDNVSGIRRARLVRIDAARPSACSYLSTFPRFKHAPSSQQFILAVIVCLTLAVRAAFDIFLIVEPGWISLIFSSNLAHLPEQIIYYIVVILIDLFPSIIITVSMGLYNPLKLRL